MVEMIIRLLAVEIIQYFVIQVSRYSNDLDVPISVKY